MPFFKRIAWNLPCLLGLVFSILFLVQPIGLAQSVNDWVNPRQENGGWISDRADLLPWQTEHHLNRRINILDGRTSAELAIATLLKLADGQSAHEFALNLFNTWGIGKRDANNGVLLLVSQADRRIEIITGQGLSETLPDADIRHLIQQTIVLAFQRQEYAAGVIQATTAIAQRLEAQLPNTIIPSWMPTAFVWIPWIVALVGVGLGLFGSIQAIAFSVSRVQVSVPTEGIDTKTFANSSDQLAAYSFPKLLARLFTPNERDWQQEIPDHQLSYVWVGGWLLGIGLIQGFWLFVLMHPQAEVWQRDATAWGICAFASSVWLLWGTAVASRFVKRERFWQSLLRHLLIVAVAALMGGYLWMYHIPTWSLLIVLMVCFFIVGWGAWRIAVGDDLQFRRQREYCSDRTGTPVQELNTEELDKVLKPDEKLARSMEKLEFRGWREAEVTLPLTREQIYLVQRSIPPVWSCKHCQSFAVKQSERTVEKTIEITKKINRKQKEKTTSVKEIKQTIYTCSSCGFVDAYDQRNTFVSSSNDSNDYSSEYSGTGYSSSSSDNTSSCDNTSSNDDGNSSTSDFGGGSSDGGGAGSDW
ncbi:MAG TPA: TPM domain-containing protein [Crinalium sp.]